MYFTSIVVRMSGQPEINVHFTSTVVRMSATVAGTMPRPGSYEKLSKACLDHDGISEELVDAWAGCGEHD